MNFGGIFLEWIYLVFDPTLVSKVVLTIFMELFLVCDLF
jgi:hypothetical protein